jgi:hypothetical protein
MPNELSKELRPLDVILETPMDKLTEAEQAIVKDYQQSVDDLSEDKSHVPQPLQISIVHGDELFKLPDATTVSELQALIVHSMVTRGFYSPNEDDDVLYCQSIGGVMGKPTKEGRETHDFLASGSSYCTGCAGDEWLPDNKGKMCKEMRRMLVFVPGFTGLLRLSASPKALKYHDKYFSDCKTSNQNPYAQWTKFTLDHGQAGKKQYSILRYHPGDTVPTDVYVEGRKLRAEFAKWLKADVDQEDYYSKAGGGAANGAPSGEQVQQAPADEDTPPPLDDEDDLPF